MNYQYRAVERFWRNFYRLRSEEKESVRRVRRYSSAIHFTHHWGSHEIHELSARAKHTIYSATVEADLRVIFRIDDSWVTTLDVGTHKMYRG